LVRCTQCELVFVGERPDAQALEALYTQSYFANADSGKVGYTNYLKDEPNIRKTFDRRLRWLERHIQPGKLLDVGCALGFFLDEAHKRGWEVSGLDVSQYAVDTTRDRFGYDVRLGSLLKQDFTQGAFDLVTLWDVIEHVADPKAYLQVSAKLLRPGGAVVLATPDVGSIPARLTGRRWVGYKLSEEHVYYFSRQTLTAMLDSAGFDVIDFRHIGKYVTTSLFLNRLGMYAAPIAQALALAERAFQLSERSLYVNPLDIMGIVARKRG
jgi:2-polyprenyl-3-methyl-5-hydroxy-6-metoxy-1,4-benzoquinol methylase